MRLPHPRRFHRSAPFPRLTWRWVASFVHFTLPINHLHIFVVHLDWPRLEILLRAGARWHCSPKDKGFLLDITWDKSSGTNQMCQNVSLQQWVEMKNLLIWVSPNVFPASNRRFNRYIALCRRLNPSFARVYTSSSDPVLLIYRELADIPSKSIALDRPSWTWMDLFLEGVSVGAFRYGMTATYFQ